LNKKQQQKTTIIYLNSIKYKNNKDIQHSTHPIELETVVVYYINLEQLY